jgi:hypothetical protein
MWLVIPLLLGFMSLALWLAAGLLALVGVTSIGEEGAWVPSFVFFVAGLAAYVAWLFTRAAVRIARTAAPNPTLRRHSVQLTAIYAIGAGLMCWLLTRSVSFALLVGFVFLAGGALRAAEDFEPPRKKRRRSRAD